MIFVIGTIMDNWFDFKWLLLLITVVLIIAWLMKRPLDFPPGPIRIPVIGNVLSINSNLRVTFGDMRKQYGDIFSVYVFNQPIVVINGYDFIKSALVNNDMFQTRPSSFFSDHLFKKKGIAFTSGIQWREHRRFALSTLRDFGMGKSISERKIIDESSMLIEAITTTNGKPFNVRYMINCTVANVICAIAFGNRFEYSDPTFQKVANSLDTIVKSSSAGIINIFPFVRYLPGDFFNFWKLTEARDTIENECISPIVEEHLKNYNDNDVSDFISAYIKEMKTMKQQGKETTMDEENLRSTVFQLFGAGTETTATTLRWILIYFLHYPEVQEKCFQEIQQVIGLERSPSMKDKLRLPYVEATIAEVQRCADIAPTNVPHSASATVVFKGYTIPKGTIVLPMLSSIHADVELWGDPKNFRPERFLDEDGKFVKKDFLLPFSLGRRSCLGESLARVELFLLLTVLTQRFKFTCDSDIMPSFNCVPGIVYSPEDFLLKATSRL